jgi:Domain of unknown function (DU1801)
MITVEESLGTIDEVFAKASATTLPIITAAHKYLIELNPDAVIVPRRGEKSVAYGIGVKKMSEAYCYLIPFKDYVNFGFFHGTDIDVDGILEGTGAKMRHIKIHTLEDLDNPELKELVLRAIKDRKAKV